MVRGATFGKKMDSIKGCHKNVVLVAVGECSTFDVIIQHRVVECRKVLFELLWCSKHNPVFSTIQQVIEQIAVQVWTSAECGPRSFRWDKKWTQ